MHCAWVWVRASCAHRPPSYGEPLARLVSQPTLHLHAPRRHARSAQARNGQLQGERAPGSAQARGGACLPRLRMQAGHWTCVQPTRPDAAHVQQAAPRALVGEGGADGGSSPLRTLHGQHVPGGAGGGRRGGIWKCHVFAGFASISRRSSDNHVRTGHCTCRAEAIPAESSATGAPASTRRRRPRAARHASRHTRSGCARRTV